MLFLFREKSCCTDLSNGVDPELSVAGLVDLRSTAPVLGMVEVDTMGTNTIGRWADSVSPRQ